MDEPQADTEADPVAMSVDEERALRQLLAAEATFDALIKAQARRKDADEAEVKKATQSLIRAQAALSYERRKHEQELQRAKKLKPDQIDFNKVRDQIREQLDRIRRADAANGVPAET